jgi:predicted SAM-dependent methyltransferase
MLDVHMKREAWLALLKECARILRPGGILRITERTRLASQARRTENQETKDRKV